MIKENPQSIYDKHNPFLAKLTQRRLLNKEGSQKETLHLAVDISGSTMTYTCGDSLGIYPTNAPQAVTDLLQAFKAMGDESVTLPRTGTVITLKEALERHLSLANPSKAFLTELASTATDPAEQAQLRHLLSPEAKEELKAFLNEREYIDIFEAFPSATVTPQVLVDNLKKLIPRLYSIASAPLRYPNEIHLTVAVVRYTTHNRPRIGVCSTYLADRCLLDAAVLPVYIAPSHFGLPTDTTKDLIMVGPGTGIAPFRAFLQQRAALKATGRHWLFFGDQRSNVDYLYEEEWKAYEKASLLHRIDLAFSRDQQHKIYVQHRMIERGADIWAWLKNGAYFYVCGDAKKMAPDVDQVLHEIVEQHGKQDPKAYIRQMKKEKRYQRDVY